MKEKSKYFISHCIKSWQRSYKLPMPAFPNPDMDLTKFGKRNFKVFIRPFYYMAIKANWKQMKRRFRNKEAK